jgi:hypothetical protein
MTLGDLLEGIVLHAFEGKCPFEKESLRRIKELKKFYGLKLDSRASHRMKERSSSPTQGTRSRRPPRRTKAKKSKSARRAR